MNTFHTSIAVVRDYLALLGSLIVDQTRANIDAVMMGFAKGGTDAFSALPPLAILFVQLLIFLFLVKIAHMIFTLSHEMHFPWNKAKRYSVHREGGKRVLVIGDSTAYGTGASRPEDTIAGRLGSDFPRAEIVNTAVNGSLVRQAIGQLERAGEEKFDLIIICTGGNDILRFVSLASLARDLPRLLEGAIEKSGHQVVLLFYANLGNARVFPPSIRSLLGRRTRQVYEIFKRAAAQTGVPLVELYTDVKSGGFSNPFIDDPYRYYARDQMHPNSEGYRLWYNRMWREMRENHFTFSE